eukprot:CAMPEP_0197458370 /NCGR_PEP_ID=MMETSP1175-20131217/48457_1 /TAXON_ID=1003142 /ORGANISM="Triceratium dubium, Strain CCMP147" /LENGTH=42 /DNA_ID= /DNA_START= /DNA_END= /DNA_ORIENTATION=
MCHRAGEDIAARPPPVLPRRDRIPSLGGSWTGSVAHTGSEGL